tara:strand:+ start:646 stop:843 length:198 start_codon:yes stop_codon:yes gene_type:complete
MLKKRFSSILLIPAILGGFSILSIIRTDSAKAYACSGGWCYNTYSDGYREYWPSSSSSIYENYYW